MSAATEGALFMASTQRAPLKPLNEALAQLLAAVVPITQTQQVATLEADGRVLAQDVVSALHVREASAP